MSKLQIVGLYLVAPLFVSVIVAFCVSIVKKIKEYPIETMLIMALIGLWLLLLGM